VSGRNPCAISDARATCMMALYAASKRVREFLFRFSCIF
jgi:hypothetical protein